MIPRICWFLGVVILSLCAGFLLPDRWLEPCIRYAGYYFMLAGFVIWLLLIANVMRGKRWRNFFRFHAPAMVLAVALMISIFHISPPQFKILGDEANLVGVSMAMHAQKTTAVPVEGWGLEYHDFDYQGNIDQRPLLFPFAVSLGHAVLGYSPYNVFIVNFAAGVLLLFVFYLFVTNMFSKYYGLLAMLLLASFPVYAFWVTSGGFETLNLFFVVMTLYVLYAFVRHQKREWAELLFFTLALLACCRYESGWFFIGLAAAAGLLLQTQMIMSYRFTVCLVPVLMIPTLWQRRLFFFHGAVESGGVSQHPEPLFGLANLAANLPNNTFVLTGLDSGLGFLPLVFAAAIIGVYLGGRKLIADPAGIPAEDRVMALFFLLTGLPLFFIYSAFYWGDFTLSMDNRLALVFLPFLIVPAIYFLHRVFKRPGFYGMFVLAVLVGIQFLYYRPVAEKQQIIKGKSLTYEYERVLDFLYSRYDLKEENLLIISDRTNFYTIHGIGSIGFPKAMQKAGKLNFLDQIYYDHILVVQRGNLVTDKLKPGTRLKKPFSLTPLKKIGVTPDYYVLISEADISLEEP